MEEKRRAMLDMIENGELPFGAKMQIKRAKTEADLDKIMAKYASELSADEVAFNEYMKALASYDVWAGELADCGESHGDVFGSISIAQDDSDYASFCEKAMQKQVERMKELHDQVTDIAKFRGVKLPF